MVDVGVDAEGKARGSKRPRIRQKYEWNDKSDVIGEGTYGLVFRAKQKVFISFLKYKLYLNMNSSWKWIVQIKRKK